MTRLDYLDGWRGLAIGCVLAAHFLPPIPWLDSGRFGVDLFFCLSGLLMARVLFIDAMPLRTFYKRRISRVVPVFLLFLVTVSLVGWTLTQQFSLLEFLSTASFLRTYIPATPGIWQASLPIGHMWSLNAEEHAYLFLSLVTLLALRTHWEGWVLIGSGVLSMAIHLLYIKRPAFMPSSGDLGTEVVAAHLLISAGYALLRDRTAGWVSPWMPAVAVGAAFLCHTAFAPWWSAMLLSPWLLAFAINHVGQAADSVRQVLAAPMLCQLGLWSFSLYIWQQPFYTFQQHFPGGMALLLAMLVGVGSFHFVEMPARAWLNKHW